MNNENIIACELQWQTAARFLTGKLLYKSINEMYFAFSKNKYK